MNNFKKKLEKAESRLSDLLAQQEQLNANALPGTFVTGRSGISRSYSKRLDRQLDKTIDLAKDIIQLQRNIVYLRLNVRLFDEGKIHANGQPVSQRKPKKSRPRSELQKILKQASCALSIDGTYPLGGYLVEVMGQWNETEKELEGFIVVTNSMTGEVVMNKAESIQGVDLEKKWIEVIKELYAQAKADNN